MDHEPNQITRLLMEYSGGNKSALPALLPPLYKELKALSQRNLVGGQTHSPLAQPTALLHEAYTKLIDSEKSGETSRVIFFSLAAQLMRRILVEQAKRDSLMAKQTEFSAPQTVNEALRWSGEEGVADVLAIDNALEELAEFNPRQARIFELRYFGGLTLAEAASAIHTDPEVTRTDWEEARTWVLKFIQNS